jgi:hypothetical protein
MDDLEPNLGAEQARALAAKVASAGLLYPCTRLALSAGDFADGPAAPAASIARFFRSANPSTSAAAVSGLIADGQQGGSADVVPLEQKQSSPKPDSDLRAHKYDPEEFHSHRDMSNTLPADVGSKRSVQSRSQISEAGTAFGRHMVTSQKGHTGGSLQGRRQGGRVVTAGSGQSSLKRWARPSEVRVESNPTAVHDPVQEVIAIEPTSKASETPQPGPATAAEVRSISLDRLSDPVKPPRCLGCLSR